MKRYKYNHMVSYYMIEDESGEYVRYKDAQAEIEKLKSELEYFKFMNKLLSNYSFR